LLTDSEIRGQSNNNEGENWGAVGPRLLLQKKGERTLSILSEKGKREDGAQECRASVVWKKSWETLQRISADKMPK